MAQMMNLAMKPEIEKSAAQSKQIQEEAAAKSTQNSVDVSTYITDKALELVKANPGMDFDDAREKILDTMDRIEKRQSK